MIPLRINMVLSRSHVFDMHPIRFLQKERSHLDSDKRNSKISPHEANLRSSAIRFNIAHRRGTAVYLCCLPLESKPIRPANLVSNLLCLGSLSSLSARRPFRCHRPRHTKCKRSRVRGLERSTEWTGGGWSGTSGVVTPYSSASLKTRCRNDRSLGKGSVSAENQLLLCNV